MQQRDFRHTVLGNLFVTILLCDGTVTVHAHPYQKNTEQNDARDAGHSHSEQVLWLLHMSYHMLFVFFAIAAFVFAAVYKIFIRKETQLLYASLYSPFSQNKSPPFLMGDK